MDTGLITYKRLKATLDMEDSSLTLFSAELATSIPQLKWVVVKYAGSNEIPKNAEHQKIMAAVTSKLSHHSKLCLHEDSP